MHPDGFTLRQLLLMSEAVVREHWGRVSYLAAYTHNAGINCTRAVTPREINPYVLSRRSRKPKLEAFREMKGMLF